MAQDGDRIAKIMSRAGLCSRREAEQWIADGRVQVDGKVLTSPALVVGPGARIIVDGKPVDAPRPTRLWRYHKPAGILTTHKDPQGRPTVFERLPEDLPRVVSVGRLDYASEGLLLLTNNGSLARHLELPATGWTRRYRVRVFGRVDEASLAALARGVTVSGIKYGPIEATLERQTGSNAWLRVTLREGKNREVRKVMEHVGYQVNRLIRTAYGPFQLGNLGPGELAPVPSRVGADQLPDFFDATQQGASAAKAKPRRRPQAKAHRPAPTRSGKQAGGSGGRNPGSRAGPRTKPRADRRR